MVMDVERVAETVFVTTRPAYQQTYVNSLVSLDGQRRHKQEIKLQPALKPIKYSDTAYILLNNTRKRFRSRTFYKPSLINKSFADTTFATPKTVQERFVSSMELHSDRVKKNFKTSIEIKPRVFKSSASFPDIQSHPSSTGHLTNGFFPTDGGGGFNDDVDENMNRRLPVFQEKYDPGASQVYIPKRKDCNFSSCSSSSRDLLLDSVRNTVLIDYNGHRDNSGNGDYSDNLCNGYRNVNGDITSDSSDL